MTPWARSIGARAMAMLLVLALPAAAARGDAPNVFAPGSAPFGKPFSQWTAEWWQFVVSIPTSVNPLLDQTGEHCMLGQHGPVWFLVGTTNGTATRSCSIPEGTALLFPVFNFVNINTPNVCGQSGNVSAKDLRAQIAPLVGAATALTVKLDGQAIDLTRSRVTSVPFDVTLPADNIFNSPCGGAGSVPAGVYSPAVDDGFYVMLRPLAVGAHTLTIHAEAPALPTPIDVTYHLSVIDVSSK